LYLVKKHPNVEQKGIFPLKSNPMEIPTIFYLTRNGRDEAMTVFLFERDEKEEEHLFSNETLNKTFGVFFLEEFQKCGVLHIRVEGPNCGKYNEFPHRQFIIAF